MAAPPTLRMLGEDSVRRIRKTTPEDPDDPPRVSVYDVLSAITGLPTNGCSTIWSRLQDSFPDVATGCCNFKFPGQGQRPTPTADARQITAIIMLLPGTAAAAFRRKCADIMVRFMGGDPSLVAEIAANRLAQESIPEDHPMRIFGETVESETLTRKREELQIVELDARIKRARVQGVCDAVAVGLQALKDLDLPIDDRDRMRAKDLINQATFEAPKDTPQDKEICIREFLQRSGHRDASVDSRLGKTAKALLLKDNPAYVFPKKEIYANGQMLQANVWYEYQSKYLEQALALLTQAAAPPNLNALRPISSFFSG